MSNGKITVEFEISDIPMIVDAMALASSTALCFHGRGKRSRERFQELKSTFESFSPIPRGYAREGYAWFDACSDARNADRVEVRFVVPRRVSMVIDEDQNGILSVVVNGVSHKISDPIPSEEAGEICLAVMAALESIVEPDVDLRMTARCSVLLEGEMRSTAEVSKEKIISVINEQVPDALSGEDDVVQITSVWSSRTGSGRVEYECLVLVRSDMRPLIEGEDFNDHGHVPTMK